MLFTIPVNEDQLQHSTEFHKFTFLNLNLGYLLRVASDEFVLDDTVVALSLSHSILPTTIKPHTGVVY